MEVDNYQDSMKQSLGDVPSWLALKGATRIEHQKGQKLVQPNDYDVYEGEIIGLCVLLR